MPFMFVRLRVTSAKLLNGFNEMFYLLPTLRILRAVPPFLHTLAWNGAYSPVTYLPHLHVFRKIRNTQKR